MKSRLMDNLLLKILSFLAAIILWLVVVNVNDAEQSKNYTVEVSMTNTNVITDNGKLFRVEDDTNIVKVKVRARRSILKNLKAADFVLTADMEKDLKYDSLVGITVECKNKNVDVDNNVTLGRTNVKVSIEDSATEQFPVLVKSSGKEGEGYVVGRTTPEQSIINVTGPASIVEKIKTIEADVDVTGLTGTAVKNCSLKVLDSYGDEVDKTYLSYAGKESGIDVTVTMLVKKTLPLEFHYSGTPADHYEITGITSKPDSVVVAGKSGTLSSLSKLTISSSAVNVDGITGELQLVVDLTEYLPAGVSIPNSSDASVVVTVSVEYHEPEPEPEETEPPVTDDGETGTETGTGTAGETVTDGGTTGTGGTDGTGTGADSSNNTSHGTANNNGTTTNNTETEDTNNAQTESGNQ